MTLILVANNQFMLLRNPKIKGSVWWQNILLNVQHSP